MSFEDFKADVIAKGEAFGGKANPKADGVLKFMYRNFLADNKPYCPCQPEKSADTVCPCVKYRTGAGCCCNLFQK
jgi:hypothetical protein